MPNDDGIKYSDFNKNRSIRDIQDKEDKGVLELLIVSEYKKIVSESENDVKPGNSKKGILTKRQARLEAGKIAYQRFFGYLPSLYADSNKIPSGNTSKGDHALDTSVKRLLNRKKLEDVQFSGQRKDEKGNISKYENVAKTAQSFSGGEASTMEHSHEY